jgi:hypothetical protein
LRERRDLHAGQPNVDAIDGRPVDLCRRVETLRRRADELKILRPFEHHPFGDRHVSGVGGKLAIFGGASCQFVKYFPALRTARRRIDIPTLCRRRDEHGSCGCTRLAQGLPRRAYRVRIARRLNPAQQGISVELLIGGRVFDPHLA